MKYELWISEKEDSYSLLPSDVPAEDVRRKLLEPDARLVLIIEAENWEEACVFIKDFGGMGKFTNYHNHPFEFVSKLLKDETATVRSADSNEFPSLARHSLRFVLGYTLPPLCGFVA